MKIRQLEQSASLLHSTTRSSSPAARQRATLALAAGVLAGCWAIASMLREVVDYPLIRAVNGFARRAPLVDRALAWITTYYLLSGVLFVSVVWYCWFACQESRARSRVLLGTIGACLAGMAGRVLQLALPTHLRPMHDAALGMTLPVGVDPAELNHWSSFPSDHAAVQFGLATVVFLARPQLGVAALAWALFLNAARVYLGAHYPTDIGGGAALGVLAVLLAQTPAARIAGRWLLGWERRAPAGFYLLAFLISYQIATLFDETRIIAAALVHSLLLHSAA